MGHNVRTKELAKAKLHSISLSFLWFCVKSNIQSIKKFQQHPDHPHLYQYHPGNPQQAANYHPTLVQASHQVRIGTMLMKINEVRPFPSTITLPLIISFQCDNHATAPVWLWMVESWIRLPTPTKSAVYKAFLNCHCLSSQVNIVYFAWLLVFSVGILNSHEKKRMKRE